MKKVTEFTKKVKGQVNNPVLTKASWVVGIDIGKKKISCVLMKKDQTVLCRFNKAEARLSMLWSPRGTTGWFWDNSLKIITGNMC